jgi:DNA ligase (NAD+)
LEEAKTRELWKILTSLSIRHVGPVAARALCNQFGSIEKILQASEQELSQVDGVGPTLAKSIKDWYQEPWHQRIIERWKLAGVQLEIPDFAGPVSTDGIFSGMTIVVTGSMQSMTREDAEAKIIAQGGKASSSVSKKTSFVVAGPGAGSKLAKAEELGVEVIDEATFIARLGG